MEQLQKVKFLGLCWWDVGEHGKVLCRVISLSNTSALLRILTITPEQALAVRHGAYEEVQTLVSTLTPAE